MKWYYADGDNPVGPVGNEEFRALIERGKITGQTLVWRSGMADWQRYEDVREPVVEAPGEQMLKEKIPTIIPEVVGLPKMSVCSECGGTFSREEMIQYEGSWICETCKPMFVQKLKEGVRLAGVMQYAGFWIRFVAKCIDGLVLMILYIVLGISTETMLERGPVIFPVMTLSFQVVVTAVYITWFVGKYGATPGKMVCRLRIVHADGSKVSYRWALGRYFAEWVSNLIFGIGYLMAAFDEQKRALHDRICGTRVIKK